MKYINSRDFLFKDTAVTFGKFDGLHLGHRLLTEDIKRFKNEEVKMAAILQRFCLLLISRSLTVVFL